MFKRLQNNFNLDFLDNKIAEEQEKQKQQQQQQGQSQKGASPVKRTPSSARRGSGRADASSTRSGSRLRVPDAKDGLPLTKGPDPSEFVLDDDESATSSISISISRTPTPQPAGADDEKAAAVGEQAAAVKEKEKEGGSHDGDKGKSKAVVPAAVGDDELPEQVQRKLAHLEKLTAKYQDLLRNYRTAHARVSLIDPFEAILREHTSLTSIDDPGALVEFLSGSNLKYDMTREELKRVAGEKHELAKERDELKTKLEEAESKVKAAFDEAAGLRKERDEAKAESAARKDSSADPLGVTKAAAKSSANKSDDDAFFSYEDEVSRDGDVAKQLQEKDQSLKQKDEELQTFQIKEKEQTAYINELSAENASLRKDSETFKNDLEVKAVDLDAANTHIERKDLEIAAIKQELAGAIIARDAAKEEETAVTESLAQTEVQLASIQKQLKDSQDALEQKAAEAEARKSEAEENLKKYQAEHAKNFKEDKYAQGNEKGIANLRGLVTRLQADVKAKTDEATIAEARASDAERAVKMMEAEAAQTESTTAYLRQIERNAKQDQNKLHEAEQQRDALQKVVDSKKAHEQKVASLQVQLKQVQADRDKAYYAIINCGKCETPAKEPQVATPSEQTSTPARSRIGSETTDLSTQPTELGSAVATPGTPPVEEDEDKQTPTGAAKKKSKKKSKKPKKKADAEASTDAAGTKEDTIGVTVNDFIQDRDAASAKLEHKFANNPIIPLLKDMHDYVKKRTEAESDNQDSRAQHLEELIEKSDQAVKNKDYLLRQKDDEILALNRAMASMLPSDAKATFERQIEDLHNEIRALKEERDTKSARLSDLQQQLLEVQNTAASDDSLAWQDKADEHQKRIDELESDLSNKVSSIAALEEELTTRDADICKLKANIKSQVENEELIENLKEEKESMQDSMLEHGKAATDAKHELKEVKERRDRLQQEFDQLEEDSDKYRKQLKEAEARESDLKTQAGQLEADLESAKAKSASSEELEAAKSQVEALKREKEALQLAKDAAVAEIEELKSAHTASGTERDAKQQAILDELEKLKARAAELEKDLAASENLAQQRFKELSTSKELNTQFQIQLKKLKQESDELRAVKTDLEKSNAQVRKLEGKAKDLRSEITEYKSQAADKDTEIASLRGKAKTSEDRSKALEESYETARKDLEKTQSARDEAVDAREKLQISYKKLEEELKKQRPRIEELEKQVRQLTDESNSLREDLQTKETLQKSADSYVQSVQDQHRELVTRSKEMQERVDGLEEELADTQRTLSERSREGDTMRRLLADAESRADAKTKEYREQRDLAIEERDRAEADASTVGRKKAREIEDLKAKLRDAEQEAARASEARRDSEKREQDFKSSRAELERRLAQAQEDADATRTAMTQLHNSLDEGERQTTQLEKDKQDLRKQLEEREARLERLQKSSKTMAEELQQLKKLKQAGGGSGSSRTSIDSSAANRSRITSPAPAGRPSTSSGSIAGGAGSGDINYVYLRQVLLQFLGQKEKKHQLALVPVLGQLLHFDKAEEQKWSATIAAK
ncbi:Putative GRIP domain-containing protein [Septoria linicola]|uniref:GRIP domain-containing protein n=1 Tax=Septoria linicola TaxID=215465 RepID=A0A9Q9EKM3_9PEZI|nr:Putative GRIP domain-containing protein [Septoria linicola]